MIRLLDSRSRRRGICLILLAVSTPVAAGEPAPISPLLELRTDETKDPDDMCVWVDPQTPSRSTIIASDKAANAVFVFDLDGKPLQRISVRKPGNIDIRQRVKLGGQLVDLVVVNQRADGFRLVAFRMNRETRQLESFDGDPLLTGPNYGGCLYHSPQGKVYFFCTAEEGLVEQHELTVANGRLANRKVRSIQLGKCEGAVADDENRAVYIAEETKGLWKVGAEPDDEKRDLIVRVGSDGVKGDLEGVALHRTAGKGGCLLVSDQGRDRFLMIDRTAPHALLGEFQIAGAEQTDGIDVVSADLGGPWAGGAFLCHTDREPRAVLVTPWKSISPRIRPAAGR